jgi:hypothetical protein
MLVLALEKRRHGRNDRHHLISLRLARRLSAISPPTMRAGNCNQAATLFDATRSAMVFRTIDEHTSLVAKPTNAERRSRR